MTSAETTRTSAPNGSSVPPTAADVANVSPEGPPAHPETSPRQIGLLLAGIVIGLLIIALAAAVWWSSIAGIVVGSFAIIIFVSNPEVWAAVLRARERRPLHRTDASDSS